MLSFFFFLLKKRDKYRYQLQSGWPRESGSVLIKKLFVVSYKQKLQTLCILKDLIMFCMIFFLFLFSLFFFKCARLGCAMKKCQKVWFPWQKPSTYGWLLESFHMVLKEKKVIKIFHFLLHSVSLCLSLCLSLALFIILSLCSSWVWRNLSHDCWRVFWFILFCYN